MISVLLTLCIFLTAALYSTVGHAGASGYLASMALFGLAPSVMRPSALVLNILVATIGTIRFARAGCFVGRIFWPLAIASIPCAFLGGRYELPNPIYKQVVGIVLVFAAYRLWRDAKADMAVRLRQFPAGVGLVVGALLGFLSGLTGVGGGIFLSPLLLVMRWATPRQTAGISAAFILVNSISGLSGQAASIKHLPLTVVAWAIAAAVGGAMGSYVGSRQLASSGIRRMLAIVLVVAAFKLIFETKQPARTSQPTTQAAFRWFAGIPV